MVGMVIFDYRKIVLDSGILHRTGHCNREIDLNIFINGELQIDVHL